MALAVAVERIERSVEVVDCIVDIERSVEVELHYIAVEVVCQIEAFDYTVDCIVEVAFQIEAFDCIVDIACQLEAFDLDQHLVRELVRNMEVELHYIAVVGIPFQLEEPDVDEPSWLFEVFVDIDSFVRLEHSYLRKVLKISPIVRPSTPVRSLDCVPDTL